MLLRLQTLATGRTGVRRATAELYAAMLNAGIAPVIGEYGSLGCSGDLAPLSHVALAAMGEGTVRGASRRGARHRRRVTMDAPPRREAGLTPVVLAEKEGLALVNGTDGMLAMLWLALADLDRLLDTADLAAAMSVEGLLGTDAPFAAELWRCDRTRARRRARRRSRRCSPAARSSRATRARRTPACRTPTRCGARRRCTAPRATPPPTPSASPRSSSRARSTTRWCCPTAAWVSNGNFHGAPVAAVLDFLAISIADVASMSERRTRPLPRPVAVVRAAAVPRPRPGRRLRPHDRAVHAGRHRLRAQAAREPRIRRLHPLERDAGGPRLDGLGRRPQAAARDRRPRARARDRGHDGRARHRAARAARRRPHRRRDRAAAPARAGRRPRSLPRARHRGDAPPRANGAVLQAAGLLDRIRSWRPTATGPSARVGASDTHANDEGDR